MADAPRRGLIVPGVWIQAAVLVILLGFTVLLASISWAGTAASGRRSPSSRPARWR